MTRWAAGRCVTRRGQATARSLVMAGMSGASATLWHRAMGIRRRLRACDSRLGRSLRGVASCRLPLGAWRLALAACRLPLAACAWRSVGWLLCVMCRRLALARGMASLGPCVSPVPRTPVRRVACRCTGAALGSARYAAPSQAPRARRRCERGQRRARAQAALKRRAGIRRHYATRRRQPTLCHTQGPSDACDTQESGDGSDQRRRATRRKPGGTT